MKKLFFVAIVIGLFQTADAQENKENLSLAEDIKLMQGKWQLDQDRSFLSARTTFDSVVAQPKRQFSSLDVDGNQLILDGGKIKFLLANEFRIDGIQLDDRRLICLVSPNYDGRAYLASYRIEGNSLEIRYPPTCVCGRSGKILHFKRVKKKSE